MGTRKNEDQDAGLKPGATLKAKADPSARNRPRDDKRRLQR